MLNWIVFLGRTVHMYKNGFGIKKTYNGWYAIKPNHLKYRHALSCRWIHTDIEMLSLPHSVNINFITIFVSQSQTISISLMGTQSLSYACTFCNYCHRSLFSHIYNCTCVDYLPLSIFPSLTYTQFLHSFLSLTLCLFL